MKAVALIDSFKGCATSKELNQAALAGLSDQWTERINIPIADGGEGTMEAIYEAKGGEWVAVTTQTPLGAPLTANYLLTTIENQQVAIIESASYIGLHLVQATDESIRQATTYGLGVVLNDAIAKGVKRIYLTLGGSGTSDGGIGLLQALSGRTKDYLGNPLLQHPLESLTQIKLTTIELIGIADVTNPYAGSDGFAAIFGPQKGANPDTVHVMDEQAAAIVEWAQEKYQVDLTMAGAGAAGGLGGAILLLGGQIVSGFMTIQQLVGVTEHFAEADLILTGEGRMDSQTAHGKVPYGVACLAQEYGVPVIGLCGSRVDELGELEDLLLGVFSIQQSPMTLAEAMKKSVALNNMRLTVKEVSKLLAYTQWHN